MSKFQLVVIILFGLAIVGGILAFSLYKGSSSATTDLSVWGTISEDLWNAWYSSSPVYKNRLYRINYFYIPAEDFDSELVNAIAEARGPDIIFAFHEKLLKNQTKLFIIPYSSFALRDFQNTFIDAAGVLTTPTGELGIPLVVDPLVLYYNKDIFANASLVEPPKLWEQMYTLSPDMTKKDPKTGRIVKSLIPLGDSSNVLYAKDILATLIMQAGGKVVEDTTSFIRSSLSNQYNLPYSPGNAALLFFTEFSNPTKIFFTWNRSLPDSLTAFSAGDSAMFVGRASDFQKIKEKNPNLLFDVAPVPQGTGAARSLTFGRLLSLAVPKGSPKAAASFGAVFEMMTPEGVQSLSKLVNLPPARRDSLQTRPGDPTASVFYDAAIQSVAWKDPDSEATNIIFKNMVDSVTSGRARVEEAVNRANEELKVLIENLTPQPITQNAIQ